MASLPQLPAPLDQGLDHASRVLFETAGAANLLAACLYRIRQHDDELGCMTCVDVEGALQRAHELDSRNRFDCPLPLHGIPVVVKEIISVAGMPDSAATRLSVPDLFAPEGDLIKRLRELGCIIVGKTVSTEFAFAQFNSSRRMPLNPADSARLTGGSSAGSAAAVAAGYCGFSVGTDTGGSVRAPAAFCGVTGFKPTPGEWSMEGILPLSPGLDSPGSFTRSAADAAYLRKVLAGDKGAGPSLPVTRIGVPDSWFYEGLDAEIEAAMQTAQVALAAAGIELVPFGLPSLGAVEDYFAQIVPQDVLRMLGRQRCKESLHLLDPLTRSRLEPLLAGSIDESSSIRRAAERLRDEVSGSLSAAGLRCWLSPTTPVVAPRRSLLDDSSELPAWQSLTSRNTRCINVLRMPAITLPLVSAVPAGLQLAGLPGRDAELLHWAVQVERCLLN